MATTPTWNGAKHLLGEYDATATEIFAVGLSLSRLPSVVAALSKLPMLEIMSFEDETFDPPERFDHIWRSRPASTPRRNCRHSLRSANGTPEHLRVFLRADTEAAVLEVELVLWNDLTLPRDLEAAERDQRSRALVTLAEACRKGAPGIRCILAPEHNGPTDERVETNDAWQVVW